jgi:hypothetical protein
MMRTHHALAGLALTLTLLGSISATTLASLSFDDLTDKSELVIAGTVTSSWVAWDAEHKYIWTHYQVSVDSTLKGRAAGSIEIAELGGIIQDTGMSVVGTVSYQIGEDAVIFLSRQPNGYLRTTGWGQGKYILDANHRLHGDASLRQVELVRTPGAPVAVSSIRSLDGMSLSEIAQRVAARVRVRASQGGAQ